jgi:hypothetical protein
MPKHLTARPPLDAVEGRQACRLARAAARLRGYANITAACATSLRPLVLHSVLSACILHNERTTGVPGGLDGGASPISTRPIPQHHLTHNHLPGYWWQSLLDMWRSTSLAVPCPEQPGRAASMDGRKAIYPPRASQGLAASPLPSVGAWPNDRGPAGEPRPRVPDPRCYRGTLYAGHRFLPGTRRRAEWGCC